MTKIIANKPLISIPRANSKIFMDLAEQYLNNPTEKLKLQMLDIYVPHLQSQAEYYAKKQGISFQDYLQKLYVKFFTYLESAVYKKYPTSVLSNRLTCVKPSKDDTISFNHTPIEQISHETEWNTLSYTLDDPILQVNDKNLHNKKSKKNKDTREKTPKVEQYNPEEIWETIQKNSPPLDIVAELEDIMATQTRYASVFTNSALKSRVKNFLKKNPNFKFRIELPKRCNNKNFKKHIVKMSIETFGKNIFEFTN